MRKIVRGNQMEHSGVERRRSFLASSCVLPLQPPASPPPYQSTQALPLQLQLIQMMKTKKSSCHNGDPAVKVWLLQLLQQLLPKQQRRHLH